MPRCFYSVVIRFSTLMRIPARFLNGRIEFNCPNFSAWQFFNQPISLQVRSISSSVRFIKKIPISLLQMSAPCSLAVAEWTVSVMWSKRHREERRGLQPRGGLQEGAHGGPQENI